MAVIIRKACQKDVSTRNVSGDTAVLQGPRDLSTSVTISSWPVTVELIRNICSIETKQRQWRQLICTRKVQVMWEAKNMESQTDTDQLHETDLLSEIHALLK